MIVLQPEVVTEQLITQLSHNSATDESGEHLIWMDKSIGIFTSVGTRSPRQASVYLQEGEWVDETYITCGMAGCIRPDHVTAKEPRVTLISDDELMSLVERNNTMSLASLYKKAKSRGLLPSRTDYGM